MRITPINFVDDATLTSSGAGGFDLPLSNVQLTARDAVAHTRNNGDLTIEGHWNGEFRKVDSFHIFNHTGHGGLVKLQIFQNWDRTTEIYNSGAQEIYTLQGLDVDWGWGPMGFGNDDILGPEAPYWLYFTGVIGASFRLTFTRCNQAAWQLGRLFLGKYIEAEYNPEHGSDFGWQTTGKQERSHGGSLRTQRGERYRELRADMHFETEANRAIWRDLTGMIDVHEDVAISVLPAYGGRMERDRVFNAQLQQHSPFKWANPTFEESTLTFTEV